MIQRGHFRSIIFLNIHVPIEDKTDDTKGSSCEELEHVFDKFHKYHVKTFYETSMPKYVWKIFSNQQLGMIVNTKLPTMKELEQYILPHPKI
jgi:hypothetical protein